MCKLRFITRRENKVVSDCVLKINSKDFSLLNKPYYLVKVEEENNIKYIFNYLDEERRFEEEKNDCFLISYGLERIKSLEVFGGSDNHIENSCWDEFEKHLLKKMKGKKQETFIENIILGFNILRKVYFKKYEIIS